MKRWLFVSAVGLVFGLFPIAKGWTAVKPNAFYLSGAGGAYVFETNDPLKNSPVYTLGIGYSFSERWLGEIVVGYIDTSNSELGNEQIDGYPLRLDMLYSFRPKERLVPHMAVGFGGLLLDDPGGDSDLEAVFGYGVGLRYFVARSMALRADVRHLYVRDNLRFDSARGNSHLMANAGVSFQLGGDSEPPPQIDSDGDGVIDAFDRCPGTPLGVPVDVYGCPADSDGDGVPDYLDLCPDTPLGVKVDKQGCPLKDQEAPNRAMLLPLPKPPVSQVPPTVRPAIPPPQGAPQASSEIAKPEPPLPVSEIALLLPFSPGGADIRPEAGDELKRAVDFLRSHPERLIVVEGHTDSIGEPSANLDLSRKRAESVLRYLLKETGVDSERIEVRGFGQTRPVADNATQEGRRLNRRVVIRAILNSEF